MYKVVLTQVKKDIVKLPPNIRLKLFEWAKDVETFGLEQVRKIPGYHDEPLKGNRLGQRSIRLNRAYRAIYNTIGDNTIVLVVVREVNKHDY